MNTRVLHPAHFTWPALHGARGVMAVVAAVIDLLRKAPHPQPDAAVLEAAKVRAWASKVAATDPRFAADLYAAADHHERMNSAG